ncbi:LytR/AlgR family response regulator transcription factor [Chryseobacterium sp. MMS23-Vi53]|uniref:LytR/AlgR family response regulator transcription factor n=1 Tax=Chryseobacterium sp. MMS23-Vi53 TaxID=3386644 RepID=UPI0039EACD3A
MKNTLQTCIIDEQDDSECISLLLNAEFPECEIDFQANKLEFAASYLSKKTPDLLFIDIPLGDDLAVERLLSFRRNHSQIIFMSDCEQFIIQAIKTGITNYLLKPVTNLDFVITVNKVIENNKNKVSSFNIVQNKINLPTLQGFKRVNIDEIIRCEADSNYTFIYLSDKSKVVVSKTLCDFEKNLSGHNFFRIHHKHLINLEHLKEYIKGKGGQVVMVDNSVLDVSIRRKNDFLQKVA